MVADSPVIQKMVRRIRVFVASPGDVSEERKKLVSVIERINDRKALPAGILLDPWLWEMDAVPGIGRPQDLINASLDEAAIVILILWNRLGSPTGKAASGTVEEFDRAVDRYRRTGWPQVLVYYCNRSSALDSDDQLEQRKQVLQFKKQHQQDVLSASYTTTDDFAEIVENNLNKVVDSIAALPLPGQKPRMYRKVLYVKVTHFGGKQGTPIYERTVDRLEPGDQKVAVCDEAVYYTLEMFGEKRLISPRTDRSKGVVDARLVVPLRYPLIFSDADSGFIRQTVQMEIHEPSDTVLTISHFDNGLRGEEQDFATRVAEDAEYVRLIVDFSSIPGAGSFVKPKSAVLIDASGEQKQPVEIVSFGEAMFMSSFTNAKAGDLLKMCLSIEQGRDTAAKTE